MVCKSPTADGGEMTLLDSAGPTVEEKVPQETEVSLEESGKTRDGVSERSQEEDDLDEGESLPRCVQPFQNADNLGLCLEEAEQEKGLFVLVLKETKRRSANFIPYSQAGP